MKKMIFLLLFPLIIDAQTAFISGTYKLCDNVKDVSVELNFTGEPPFTFIYAIDNISQPIIKDVTDNTYFLKTAISGTYTIVSYNDLNSVGTFDGSAEVLSLISPTALIGASADTLTVLNPTINYNDLSIGNINSRVWIFDDNSPSSFLESVHHIYPTDSTGIGYVGLYQDSLIVIDDNGCSDTTTHTVLVKNQFWIYIPNSFTPDFDNINDKFCISYNGIRENTFIFKVFNSQGDLIYQSLDSKALCCDNNAGWDGTYYKNNIELPADSYVYELYFQDFEGWKHTKFGDIVLVK